MTNELELRSGKRTPRFTPAFVRPDAVVHLGRPADQRDGVDGLTDGNRRQEAVRR